MEAQLKEVIRDFPDYPKPGIIFKDISPILMDMDLFGKVISKFAKRIRKLNVDAIAGVESRGFLFGFILANKMGIPFIPIRKVGKLPGDTLKYKYELEYGEAEVEIHINDIEKGWNILIHDDLLATGGTACAAAELINQLNANIVAFTFIVSLHDLNGEERLQKYSDNIISLIDY